MSKVDKRKQRDAASEELNQLAGESEVPQIGYRAGYEEVETCTKSYAKHVCLGAHAPRTSGPSILFKVTVNIQSTYSQHTVNTQSTRQSTSHENL